MSRRRVDAWQIVCDWPGCGRVLEAGDFSVFVDAGGWDEWELLSDACWWRDRDGVRMYCPDHPGEWASDHEGGVPWPLPPYLLIHDGDTGDVSDDGTVTLVRSIEED